MLIIETKNIDGTDYKYTYSNENKMILQVQTGNTYNEAVDNIDSQFTYEETDIEIENDLEE